MHYPDSVQEILSISTTDAEKLLKEANNDFDRAVDLGTERNLKNVGSTSNQTSSKTNVGSNIGGHHFNLNDLAFLTQMPPKNNDSMALIPMDTTKTNIETSRTTGTGGNIITIDDEEDADMKRAIEASIKLTHLSSAGTNNTTDNNNSNNNKNSETGVLSTQELEEARIIEQSIRDANKQYGTGDYSLVGYENPINRKRTDTTIPVGLKNIGNTCYFNSLLQTYFAIPDIRNAVLQFPIEQYKDIKQGDALHTIPFLSELQSLFSSLILSNQKFVDPSNLINKLKDKNGNKITIGQQQDVADYLDLLFTILSTNFQLLKKEEEENKENGSGDVLKDLFFGKGVEQIVVSELIDENESKTESEKEIEYSTLILPINEQNAINNNKIKLYDAIEEYVNNNSELITEKGNRGTRTSVVWFTKLPPFLLFQESRVYYDIDKKNYIKKQIGVEFDKEIYMDRFMLNNQPLIIQKRNLANNLKLKLQKLKQKLSDIINYKGSSTSLPIALHNVIHYLNDKININNNNNNNDDDKMEEDNYNKEEEKEQNEIREIIKRMKEYHIVELENENKMKEEIKKIEEEIDKMYNEEKLKNEKYVLFGSWIHQGSNPTSGHYWSYLFNIHQNKWYQYNDMKVNEVNEEIVFNDSTGGPHSSTSASFLIYIQHSLLNHYSRNINNLISDTSIIPNKLKSQVEEDNEKFNKEVTIQEKKSTTDKFENLILNYQEKVKQLDKYSNNNNNNNNTKDNVDIDRTNNFYLFMESAGENSMNIMAIMLKDSHHLIFERPFSQDIGTSMYNKLIDKLGNEVVTQCSAYSLDDSLLTIYKYQYQIYQETSQLFMLGVNFLLEKKYKESLQHLISSYENDKKIKYTQCRRKNKILIALVITLEEFYYYSVTLIKQGLISNFISNINSIVQTTKFINIELINNRIQTLVLQFKEQQSSIISYYSTDFNNMFHLLNSTSQTVAAPFPIIIPQKLDSKQIDELTKKMEQVFEQFDVQFKDKKPDISTQILNSTVSYFL